MSQAIPAMPPRRWGRRILLVLAFLALLGGAGVLAFVWFSSSALDNLMADMDRDDPGWRLEEIEANRRVVPDGRNSALLILAIRRLQGAGTSITTANDEALENLPPQVQLSAQQAALLASRFESIKKAVAEARKLKDLPDGRFPIKYTPDFFSTAIDCAEARAVGELLLWDAAVRAHAWDADGALDSCLALHHAARAVGDEPRLISMLVRYALNAITVNALERTFAQTRFTPNSEPGLKQMQTALGIEVSEPRFLSALRGERAGAHQFFQALDNGQANPGMLGQVSALAGRLPGFIRYQHITVLRLHNKFVEAAKLPAEETDERFLALDNNTPRESIWVRQLIPAIVRIRRADQRSQAYLHCAIAGIAAERFRLARNRWPGAPGELVEAGLLDAVPADPYDYQPIRLQRTADGVVLYSVGPDKTDNGGLINRARPTDPGTDLGFRLWDVASRRQAPNPPQLEEKR